MSDHQWYGEIDALLGSSSHLFLHYGALHRVDEDGAAITQELGEAGWAAERIVLRSGRRWMPSNDTEVAVIVGMESLRSTPRALEHLRVDVNGWVAQHSAKIVIVSHIPRSAYPVGDGSSLVLDSRDVHLHECRLAEWIAQEYQKSVEYELPVAATRSRSLSSKLASGSIFSPAEIESIYSDIACQAIYELGSSYVAWLDEMVLESEILEVPLVDVPEWMQAELLVSGLGVLDVDRSVFRLFHDGLRSAWLDGLRSASRLNTNTPTDWRETASSLFEIERIVRKRLASAFASQHGRKWPSQVLNPELQSYVRESAGLEPGRGLHMLANPLDFLTFGQLLDLATARKESCSAGFNSILLSEIRKLLPIRNRVGHMRLLKDGDLQSARRVRRMLQMRLSE